jgi:hypothetical protein
LSALLRVLVRWVVVYVHTLLRQNLDLLCAEVIFVSCPCGYRAFHRALLGILLETPYSWGLFNCKESLCTAELITRALLQRSRNWRGIFYQELVMYISSQCFGVEHIFVFLMNTSPDACSVGKTVHWWKGSRRPPPHTSFCVFLHVHFSVHFLCTFCVFLQVLNDQLQLF